MPRKTPRPYTPTPEEMRHLWDLVADSPKHAYVEDVGIVAVYYVKRCIANSEPYSDDPPPKVAPDPQFNG